ncbi:hypothetical protein [Patulibacter sp. SYSU D01012]|uniref:hypothetical protein n=1 Tax=Patulibacter sp. SYSU D01012 TaxID=2817381 RepID=UPI001B317D0D|nr:hypothetical protein [Patulibacter sp. SYSU D01012]
MIPAEGAAPRGGRSLGATDEVGRWLSAAAARRERCLHVVVRGVVAVAVAAVAVSLAGLTATTAPLLVAGAAYVAGTSALLWRRALPGTGTPVRRTEALEALGDVVAITAVAAVVGPDRPEPLLFLCAVPVGYCLRLSAPGVAALSVACLAGALACWAAALLAGDAPADNGAVLLVAFGLGWCGLISTLVAAERQGRAERIGELADTAHGLLGQAMAAEEQERRRVADLLHDDVLQTLLATRQDVVEAMDGSVELLPTAAQGLDAVTGRLRETVRVLRGGAEAPETVGDGIERLLEDAADRARFHVAVELDRRTARLEHPVLLSVVRDLVRAAERTSAPSRVSVAGRTTQGRTVLVLTHDDRRPALGVPVPAAAGDDVVRAAADRARALGGSLVATVADDGERTVRISLPAATDADPAPAPLARDHG